MKYIKIALATLLVAFASLQAQTTTNALTNTYGDNIDTHAERNAYKDLMRLSDVYAGRHRLPLAVSKVWKDGRLEDQRPPLTILLWGDSLMQNMSNPDLFPRQNFLGWKLMSVDRATVSAGSATTQTDGTWLQPSYKSIGASSSVEWIPLSGATSGVRANRVGVLFYKGASSSEAFTLEASTNNGSSWTAISSSTRASGVTNGTTTITFSASGIDVPPAIGSTVTGTNIAASTYVVSSTNTSAVLSQAATGSASGITFTFGSTIDTSQATSNIVWAEFALANTGPSTRVRVSTASGKTAKVIGCGAWFGDVENYAGEGGFVLCDAWQGNIGPEAAATTANATPTAISAPFAGMQVNMVIGSWYDLVNCWDTGGAFDDVRTAADAGSLADWVMITPNPMGTAASSLNGSYTADGYSQLIRNAMIAWADRNSQNVIDLYPTWRDWTTAKLLGMTVEGDQVHPTTAGQNAKRALCGELFRRELPGQNDAITLERGPNGRRIVLSAGAYAVKSGAEATNPLSTLLWYHTGAFQTTDAITGTAISGTTITASTRFVFPTGTPASASATGTTGTITWDSSYIYVCTATNTWKRVAIATW